MSTEQPITAREVGEIIANLRHLSEQMAAFQSAWGTEFGKVHARMDEMLRSTVHTEQHDKLVAEVNAVRALALAATPEATHTKLSERVTALERSSASGTGRSRWLRDLVWLLSGIVSVLGGQQLLPPGL